MSRCPLLLLTLLSVLLPAGTALAAKPAPAAPASVAVAGAATSVPVGTWITFVTTVPSTAKDPGVRIVCSQNGATVWSQVGATSGSYKLGGDSSPWLQVGGNADCVVDLINTVWSHGQQSITVLARTEFTGMA